jgi:hypothetical protein
MLVLINTISVAIARALVRTASLLSRLQRRVVEAPEERAAVEVELSNTRYQPSSRTDDHLPLAH